MPVHQTFVGINGFGRVGRQVFRAVYTKYMAAGAAIAHTTSCTDDAESGECQKCVQDHSNSLSAAARAAAGMTKMQQHIQLCIAQINEPFLDAEAVAHAIKFDAVLGRFPGKVEAHGKKLIVIDGKWEIVLSQSSDAAGARWAAANVAVVVESSGVFTTTERAAAHITAGARKVVITAPSADASPFFMGVNAERIQPDAQVLSAGSCTAVALAPVLKCLNAAFPIKTAAFTAIHSATAQQKFVDSTVPKDARLGRGAASIMPCSSTALRSVLKVMPNFAGRVSGAAVRVPTQCVCLLDLTVELEHAVSKKAMDALFRGEHVTTQPNANAAPSVDSASTPSPSVASSRPATSVVERTMMDRFSPAAPASTTRAITSHMTPQSLMSSVAAGQHAQAAAHAARELATFTPGGPSDPIQVIGYESDAVVGDDMRGIVDACVYDASASYPVIKPSSASLSAQAQEDLDAPSTMHKLMFWYDNERGYAEQVLSLIRLAIDRELSPPDEADAATKASRPIDPLTIMRSPRTPVTPASATGPSTPAQVRVPQPPPTPPQQPPVGRPTNGASEEPAATDAAASTDPTINAPPDAGTDKAKDGAAAPTEGDSVAPL